jgi:DNA gyrase inhibitor GyrI
MGQCLPDSGERRADDTSFEIDVNNPTDAPKAELRTELSIPLAPSAG